MEYSVEYKVAAMTDLDKLTPNVQTRILGKVNWLAQNFEMIIPVSLKGNLSDFFKLRVGDYRVLYSIRLTALTSAEFRLKKISFLLDPKFSSSLSFK